MPRLNRTVISFALLTFIVFFAQISHAAINDEGAARLKTIFTDMIQQQKSAAALSDKSKLVFDGDITVEQADTYYAVTLPQIKIQYPESGDTLELGIISINATPHAGDAQWKMTMAMPTPIIMFDKDRNHIVRVNIGKQQATGIWDESLNNFSKLDAVYGDLSIESSDPGFTLKIPEIEARYDLEKDDKNFWSGPTYMIAKNVELDIPDDESSFKVEELKMRVDLDQYNPAVLDNYQTELQALTSKEGGMNAQDSAKLGSMLLDLILKSGNGFKSEYSVSGLKASFLNPKDKTPGTFDLAKAYFGFDLEGFLSKDASMNARLGYGGLNMQPAHDEYGELFPTNSNIDIKIASLPIKDISELVQNTMQGAVTNPEMMSMAGISLMFKVPLMLSQSGTTIEINDNFISNDEYKFSINGAAKADMNAVNSATAKAQARFLGLDKVLAKAQVLGANPNTKNADAFRAISANLELLKKIAIVESGAPGPYGTFAHIFNLLMDPQGKITINGKTLQEAMQGEPAQ